MSSKKIKYKYGSDCRNLSPWRMKGTLSMKWETWEVTTKKWNFNFVFVLCYDSIEVHMNKEKILKTIVIGFTLALVFEILGLIFDIQSLTFIYFHYGSPSNSTSILPIVFCLLLSAIITSNSEVIKKAIYIVILIAIFFLIDHGIF